MKYYIYKNKDENKNKHYGLELSFLSLIIFIFIFYLFYQEYDYESKMNYILFFVITILFLFILLETFILWKSYNENRKFEDYSRRIIIKTFLTELNKIITFLLNKDICKNFLSIFCINYNLLKK